MSDERVRTTLAPGYKARLGLIGLVCFLFGCWAVYDGFVKYPGEAERFAAVEAWKAENPNDWRDKWNEHAASQGWPDNPIEVENRDSFDILSQYIMAGITLPIGIWFGLSFLLAGGRYVEIEGDELRASGGRKASLGDITAIDLAKWRTKGIAKIEHNGLGKSPIVLDDWKYVRKSTTHILMTALEAHDPEAHAELKAEQEAAAARAAEQAQADAAAQAQSEQSAQSDQAEQEAVPTEQATEDGALEPAEDRAQV
ncbi:MAG: hypothetical protein AAF612_03330 [Planctomycetota bacterium]